MRKYASAVVAVSLLAVAAEPARAQSSVTLYGLLDAGISYVSNEGGHSNLKFDDGILVPNIIGFQGKEDLGGGLHAVFKLESQFEVGSGATIPWQGLFGRNAYVGLQSDKFGSIKFGNQPDFLYDSLIGAGSDPAWNFGFYGFRAGPFNKIALPGNLPWAGSYDWDHMTGSHPIHNAVKYQSPDIDGFSFGALYAFGGVAGSFGSGSTISAGANYTQGGFGVGAAYTDTKYYTEGQPIVPVQNWGVGAHYQFDKLTLQTLVTTVRNGFNGGAIAEGQVGVGYLFSPAVYFDCGYMYMKGNDFLGNNHAHQVSAILDYFLSKRTLVYVETVYQRTNSGAQALINGVLDPNGTSSGPSQLITRVGMKTSF